MSAHVTAYVSEDDEFNFEYGGLRLTLGVDVQFDTPTTLRRMAVLLLAEADERDGDIATSREHLLRAAEGVAEIRRERGEIADDGMCWACKLGDHRGHRDYNEDRCYGCGCEALAAATKGDDE